MVLALAWLAMVLSDRREYGAGLIRRRDPRDTHLDIRSSLGLTARLARRSILVWRIAVACIGTMFAAMGSSVVQLGKNNDVGGLLGAQLGTGDPIAGYFGCCGTIVGILSALIAPTVIDGHDVALRAFGYTLGQRPAAMAAAGWTALLTGRGTKRARQSLVIAFRPRSRSGTLVPSGRAVQHACPDHSRTRVMNVNRKRRPP